MVTCRMALERSKDREAIPYFLRSLELRPQSPLSWMYLGIAYRRLHRNTEAESANRRGLKTFGCTGFNGGKLRTLAQQGLHVPLDDAGIVESIHLTAFHWVVDDLHRRISL